MSENAPSQNTRILLWRALALLRGGNWSDAAYGFGGPDVAEAVGTAEEIGAELTRFLGSLRAEEHRGGAASERPARGRGGGRSSRRGHQHPDGAVA